MALPALAAAESARVDWSALRHAYGSSTELPALLEMLCSDEPDVRVDAMERLLASIWHQGTIYPAAGAAASVLATALLEAPRGAPWLSNVLLLLAHLTTGHCSDEDLVDEIRDAVAPAEARLIEWISVPRLSSFSVVLLGCARTPGASAALGEGFATDSFPQRVLRAVMLYHCAAPRALLAALRREEAEPAARLALALAEAGLGDPGESPADLLDLTGDADAWTRLLRLNPRALEMVLPPFPSLLRAWPVDDAVPHLVACGAALQHVTNPVAFRTAIALIHHGLRQQEAFDASVLTGAERQLLVALLESDAAFAYGNVSLELRKRLALPPGEERQVLLDALRLRLPVILYLAKPRDAAAASRLCDLLGVPAWKDASAVFFRGDVSFLDQAIVEDPADWPRELMDKVKEICGALYRSWIHRLDMSCHKFRLYPDHSLDQLEAVAKAASATVHRPLPPEG